MEEATTVIPDVVALSGAKSTVEVNFKNQFIELKQVNLGNT